jgi:branched-chain amino acid transport system permease protein
MMDYFLQLLVTGVMLGSIFAVVAIGWVLIYKCSRVLNLAVGELTMIGAYVSLALYTRFVQVMPAHTAFVIALAGTMFVGLVLGLLIERILLRRMFREPVFAVIMMTVGLSLFFKGMVFIIWDPHTQFFDPRVFPAEPIVFAGLSVGQVHIWSFVAALILITAVVSFFKYTRWGLSMQASSDDETAALSLGVSSKLLHALAWAIAFMAAGAGGTLLANINGLDYSVSLLGLLVLPVVVIGGLDSIPGAIVGGVAIGILQSLAGGYLDKFVPGGVKEIAPFVFMIVFLLFKPYGLWGRERTERV